MEPDTFSDLIGKAIADATTLSSTTIEAIRQYAAERTVHLSTIITEPGYEEALVIETQNVALMAGIQSVQAADIADARTVGIIAGALRIGAVAMA